MIPVDSTSISAIGYDHKTGTLRINFLTGSTYEYYGVPLEFYEGLMSASSKGKYFNLNIKNGGYAYSPV